MANRLEEVCCSDKYEGTLTDAFKGLPYLRVEAGKEENRTFKTASTFDGHRFASDFIAKGKAKFGPFSFPVESVREIRLVPFESMQQRLLSGSMKRLDVTTRLAPEGSGTRITNHTESIPDVWIPPIVGRLFIAHETREIVTTTGKRYRPVSYEQVKARMATKTWRPVDGHRGDHPNGRRATP